MEEFDQLIKGWKEISVDAAIENKKLFLNKNNSIMESIIQYEQNEKQEKKKQIYLMFWSLASFTIAFIAWNFAGTLELNMKNLIGAILLIIALAISLISNKTDDFPDARLLNSKEYLLALKENVSYRRKRNTIFAFISLAIVLPGLYLLLHNMPLPFPTPNINLDYLIIIPAILGFIGGFYHWRKKYDEVTKPMLLEIDTMLDQL